MNASELAQTVIPAILDPERTRDSLRASLEPIFEKYPLDNPEGLLAQRAGCERPAVIAFALCVGAELSIEATNALLATDSGRAALP